MFFYYLSCDVPILYRGGGASGVDADAGHLAFQATDMFDKWKDDTCDDCPGGQKVKEMRDG